MVCRGTKKIMKKNWAVNAKIREMTGSKFAERVRKTGMIPAVVYGHKKDAVAISLDGNKFVEGVHQGNRLMDVKIGKNAQKMIVKEIQYDYLGKEIIHVDMMRVDVAEMVRVTVPVELKGTAVGTHEGGILQEHADHLEIECQAGDIPETIVVLVKDIGVGDALHAGDIELAAGVKLVSSPEMLLVSCGLVAAAKSTEELEEEAPAAPEVIGEVKEEKDESSEEKAEKRKS